MGMSFEPTRLALDVNMTISWVKWVAHALSLLNEYEALIQNPNRV